MESAPKSLIRIDLWMVQVGLAPSRSKAQELIDERAAEWSFPQGWKTIENSSMKVPKTAPAECCRLLDLEVLRFVSRGGRKLEAALEELHLDVQGGVVLDLGQSTGGFTDCLLQRGAARVVGVDVGKDQLHPQLRNDLRVAFLEESHVRDLSSSEKFKKWVPTGGFDLTVVDLSFISTLEMLGDILRWSRRSLILVKPQFELGSLGATKKKLVQSPELFCDLKSRFEERTGSLGFHLKAWVPSRLPGKDGNHEFFALIQGTAEPRQFSEA